MLSVCLRSLSRFTIHAFRRTEQKTITHVCDSYMISELQMLNLVLSYFVRWQGTNFERCQDGGRSTETKTRHLSRKKYTWLGTKGKNDQLLFSSRSVNALITTQVMSI